MIDSEVYTNSKNFVREIKGHIKSNKFMEVFGDWEGPLWSEGEIIVSTRTKVLKEASIIAAGIGTVKVGQHVDVIIGDDYNSGNNSETSEARAKVIKHFQMNQSILEPGGSYILIGTRYAIDDCYGWVLANEVDQDTREKYV